VVSLLTQKPEEKILQETETGFYIGAR